MTRNLLPTQEVPGDPTILLHNVQEAGVEFFDGSDWTTIWDSEATGSLPTGVKFRILIAPPDRGQLAAAASELIVPLFVTTSAAAQAAVAATP